MDFPELSLMYLYTAAVKMNNCLCLLIFFLHCVANHFTDADNPCSCV